jgi:hypothetical protein
MPRTPQLTDGCRLSPILILSVAADCQQAENLFGRVLQVNEDH